MHPPAMDGVRATLLRLMVTVVETKGASCRTGLVKVGSKSIIRDRWQRESRLLEAFHEKVGRCSDSGLSCNTRERGTNYLRLSLSISLHNR